MVRVYIYEAFILVLAASLMGVVIGAATAWSFTLQRTLFLQTPLEFAVPWAAIAIVAFVSALLSAAGPAYKLTRVAITRLLRAIDG
jgi:ABC-type antimicrobial peptide transport system permease subunit